MSHIALNTVSDMISDIKLDTVLENKPLPSWMFNLEGFFLGFLGDDPQKVTSIVIEVEQEQLVIELPQNLLAAARRSVQQKSLQPGDGLRCIGRSQLDYTNSTIRLNAYCLFLESSNSSSEQNRTQPLPQLVKQPKQAKILNYQSKNTFAQPINI
ncbi:MAG: hypothetical protein ACFB16_24930 [Phormidesmis sp.]